MTVHKRNCEARYYTCTCGYDESQDALIERLVKAAEKTLDNRATMISASGDGRPYVTITFDTLAEMHRFTGGMAELRAALAAKEQQP